MTLPTSSEQLRLGESQVRHWPVSNRTNLIGLGTLATVDTMVSLVLVPQLSISTWPMHLLVFVAQVCAFGLLWSHIKPDARSSSASLTLVAFALGCFVGKGVLTAIGFNVLLGLTYALAGAALAVFAGRRAEQMHKQDVHVHLAIAKRAAGVPESAESVQSTGAQYGTASTAFFAAQGLFALFALVFGSVVANFIAGFVLFGLSLLQLYLLKLSIEVLVRKKILS